MTIRECLLFAYNKKENITDEKELDFLDSVFTYLVDYYDYSKEGREKKENEKIKKMLEELNNTNKGEDNDKNS